MDQQRPVSPFAGTAVWYGRFRAPYPPAALDYVREAFNLGPATRALDLGCGPGTIAIPLAAVVAEVIAVDPDRDMIDEGNALADARSRHTIQWVHDNAEQSLAKRGSFRVVTMGQSFHWMDRDRVLRQLAHTVEDGGGLALINPGKRRPQESWEDTANAIVAKYLGPPRRHPKTSPEPAHEPSLRRSAHFHVFTAREFPFEVERDVVSIIGCLYSTSGAAKRLFGDRAPAFEHELVEALHHQNASGIFKERLETEVIIAPRS